MNIGNEVSCKVLNNYLREIELKKLDVNLFLKDCEYDLEYLKNKNNRIGWKDFGLLLDNLCEHLNYSYNDIRQIGKNSINAPFMKPVFAIAKGLYTLPEMFYWLHGDKSNKMVNYLFSCIDITCSFDSKHNFIVYFTMEEGYEPHQGFYWSSLGLMEAIPMIYGVHSIEIDMQIESGRATYCCQVPNVGGFLSKLRRFLMAPIIMTQTTKELQSAYNELYQKNEKLMNDNCQLKKIQKRLALTNIEALNSSKAKSRFVAKVSHELRTPLNGILGMNQLLQCTELNQEQVEYCQTIDDSSETLLVLLNDLLDLGQIEAGEVHLNIEKFSLKQFLKPIKSIFTQKTSNNNVKFELLVDEKIEDLSFTGDISRINQIISNLLCNAFKYTKKGFVSFQIKYEYGQLAFTIKDTGIGISPSNQKQIFEPFNQINSEKDGVGLGLSIVINLLELMDGKIEVESELNKGTVIKLFLPTEVHEQTSLEFYEQPDKNLRIKILKILLVEDNDVNQLITKKFLSKDGHEVVCAINGAIAVDCIKAESFDLVLMDINMPVMDGKEATTIIRKEYDKTVLPIIALTASASAQNKEYYKDIGMNETLAKPLRKELLTEVLGRYC